MEQQGTFYINSINYFPWCIKLEGNKYEVEPTNELLRNGMKNVYCLWITSFYATLWLTQSCILYLNREAFFCRVCFERKMYLLSAPLTNPPFLYVSSSHSCIVRWACTLSTGCSTSLLVLLAYLSLNINSVCYASFLCRLMQVCVFFSSISHEPCPLMSCRHALPNVDTLWRSVLNLIQNS